MKPNLDGIPETMLMTLRNRACESMRRDRCLEDPEAERILRAIDYDFGRSFGTPSPSHALRARAFDRVVCDFLDKHPNAVIVNLGEGLETQRYRVDLKQGLWLSVDVPEAIAIRKEFIPADATHIHVAASAFDPSWYGKVPKDRPVLITAQGLLMFFEPSQVQQHLRDLSKQFPGAVYVFDVLPRWFSKISLSRRGIRVTRHYVLPAVPWGINQCEIEKILGEWAQNPEHIEIIQYLHYPRGLLERYVLGALSRVPTLQRIMPCVVKLQFRSSPSTAV